MNAAVRKVNIQYSLMQALYWMGYAVSSSFTGVFLLQNGFNNTAVGLVIALGSVGGFLLGNILAEKIDKTARVTPFNVSIFISLASIVFLLAAVFLPNGGTVLAAIWGFGICLMGAGGPPLLKMSVDLDHRALPVNFGVARGLGSLGYVIMSLVMGRLVSRFGVMALPWGGIVVHIVRTLLCRYMQTHIPAADYVPNSQSGEEEKALSLLQFAACYKRFMLLMAGCTLIFVSHNFLNSFLINVVENVGGDASSMGTFASYIAFVEIPVMWFFHRIRRGRSLGGLMRFSLAMFSAKALAVALAPTLGWLYIAEILQPLSFALFTAGSVEYVDKVIPFKDSAKGQSLCFGVSTLGTVISGVLAGRLYDILPVRTVLLIGFAICVCGSLLAVSSVEKIQ